MPITLTPVGPASVVGPGISVTLQSDFIGPLPSGSSWVLEFFSDSDQTKLMWQAQYSANVTITTVRIMDPGTVPGFLGTATVQDGAQAFAKMTLQEPGSGVIDTGAQAVPWSSTTGLGQQISALAARTTTGGFTDTDRQQLQTIAQSTVLDHLLDTLTLQALTNGPTGEFVGANLTQAAWGILIRLANVPPELVPQTPDGDYWVPTLAVVRIFRGSDLWIRAPIHTSSKIVRLAEEGIAAAVTFLTATQWLLNMTLQVTFHPGVTGEVFVMHLP